MMDQEALAEMKGYQSAEGYQNPRHEELFIEHHDVDHLLRMPPDALPDPLLRALKHVNTSVCIPMQGPSELAASTAPLALANSELTHAVRPIETPTLVIGVRHDTMDPEHMEWMATELRMRRHQYGPNGSHRALYDDQEVCFTGPIERTGHLDAGGLCACPPNDELHLTAAFGGRR